MHCHDVGVGVDDLRGDAGVDMSRVGILYGFDSKLFELRCMKLQILRVGEAFWRGWASYEDGDGDKRLWALQIQD